MLSKLRQGDDTQADDDEEVRLIKKKYRLLQAQSEQRADPTRSPEPANNSFGQRKPSFTKLLSSF